MATANFYIKNARNYYVWADTYEGENEDGEVQEFERDEWDWNELLNDIRYRGEDTKLFPYESDDFNRRMDAREVCVSASKWETFGNGNAWTTETEIESTIMIRSGYYSGAVLDYDIRITSSQGDVFYLSEYDNMDDLMHDYLNCISDIVDWKGYQHKWNIGTFKMQKNNIRKWIEKRIENEIEICEKFCRENCEHVLEVSVRFSNGETWYKKVG